MFFDDFKSLRKGKAAKYRGDIGASDIPEVKTYEIMTKEEMLAGGFRSFVYDVESYKNYFLIAFKCMTTGKILLFEDSADSKIDLQFLIYVMYRCLVIGFNSRNYDIAMVSIALSGANCATLYEATQALIVMGDRAEEVIHNFNGVKITPNHVDLIEVAPISASLKIYAGRLHCKTMQDLPYAVDSILTQEQAIIVRNYCVNDLDNTELLCQNLYPQLRLREALGAKYNQDLRSKSDAQIAEAIIVSELRKLGIVAKSPTIAMGTEYKYNIPSFVSFQTPLLQSVLETVRNATFIVGAGGGCELPEEIKALHIPIGSCVYKMGIGGLHSTEESISYKADENTLLIDRDVASYYPRIILNQKLYPKHLGPAFLEVFNSLTEQRLYAKEEAKKAKKAGDTELQIIFEVTADGLKITINGTFGKLNNIWSKVYSPELFLQVTIGGQIFLLMFIEMVELAGIPVISANTDGVVMKCPVNRYNDLLAVVAAWEAKTSFQTEETRYKALYSRDVNNYIAIKLDHSCKSKGVFSEKGSALNSVLSKNPETLICSDAVQALLAYGVPIEQTIRASTDFRRFVSVRHVKGGAHKDGVYLGKAIRWYYATEIEGDINYVGSGNKVPKSDGAKPCMTMPDAMPDDIDYARYIAEATKILFDIDYYHRSKKVSFFD